MDVELYRNADTEDAIGRGDSYTGILRSYALAPGTYLLQIQAFGGEVDTYSVSVLASAPIPALQRIDYVRLAGEGFNAVQFTPDGRLAQLLWYGGTLTYRVRSAQGQIVEEAVTAIPELVLETFDPRDFAQAQLLFTANATPHVLMSVDGTSVDHYRRDDSGWSLVENIPLDLQGFAGATHLAGRRRHTGLVALRGDSGRLRRRTIALRLKQEWRVASQSRGGSGRDQHRAAFYGQLRALHFHGDRCQ